MSTSFSREQDSALLQSIRAGDTTAFDVLYRRFAPGLLGFIMQRVPNRAEAEELLQETFVRLLRDQRFEPRAAGLGTYLYVVARNLCLNHVRDHSGKRGVDLEEANIRHLEDPWGRTMPTPDDHIGQRQELVQLREALHRLPEQQREAFLLRHHQGRSYQEISEIVSCPVGTAKSRVHLAIASLREALESLFEPGRNGLEVRDNVTNLSERRRLRMAGRGGG